MSSEPPGSQGRRQANVRVFPALAHPPRNRVPAPAEMRVVDEHLYVTLDLPHIEDPELRYAVRRRYLLVWGDQSPHRDQHLVLLEKPVDPDHCVVRFQNGVFDAKIRLAKP